MKKPLFKNHQVYNIYFIDVKKDHKERTEQMQGFKSKLDEKLNKLKNSRLNYYLIPYIKPDQVYLKVGSREILPEKINKIVQDMINKYSIANKKHYFTKFLQTHYNIETSKFVGYEFAKILKLTIEDKQFSENKLRRFNQINGDRNPKPRIDSFDIANMFHHMCLGLNFEYTQEQYILSTASALIQASINHYALDR